MEVLRPANEGYGQQELQENNTSRRETFNTPGCDGTYRYNTSCRDLAWNTSTCPQLALEANMLFGVDTFSENY
jgi:hypothetical protein